MISFNIVTVIIFSAFFFFLGWLAREKTLLDYKHRVQKFMIDTHYQLIMMHITCVAHGNQQVSDAAKQRLKPLIDKTEWMNWVI